MDFMFWCDITDQRDPFSLLIVLYLLPVLDVGGVLGKAVCCPRYIRLHHWFHHLNNGDDDGDGDSDGDSDGDGEITFDWQIWQDFL